VKRVPYRTRHIYPKSEAKLRNKAPILTAFLRFATETRLGSGQALGTTTRDFILH
jgi:hypothetical protein